MQTRAQFADIQSYQPAADFRKTGVLGVLEGRNYAWSADGVGAAFASRLIAGGQSLTIESRTAYELSAETLNHVVADRTVWRFVPTSTGGLTGTWEEVDELTRIQTATPASVPQYLRGFTSEYIDGAAYICSWNHGVYRYDSGPDEYTRLTDSGVSGFPTDAEPVIAIAETNGRLLYLTALNLYWSGPSAPEDLVPTLGGAGFQDISQIVGGEPRAITATSTGAIVWTTQGAMTAEFVAGDAVFRFYEITSDVLPLTQTGIVRLPNNFYCLLTRLGLYQMNEQLQLQPMTPLFNEFMREYMRNRPLEVGHLWYNPSENRLYVGFKTASGSFLETFVLDVGLDKWGVLNDLHLGMFRYTGRGSPMGVMNIQGIASYFLPADAPDRTKELAAAPGTFTGLNSTLTLGYIRAENMAPIGDTIQELSEVVIYRKLPNTEFNDTFVDEGFVLASVESQPDEGLISSGESSNPDEGEVVAQVTRMDYDLTILTDLFFDDGGLTANFHARSMWLAKSNLLADTWTGGLPSYYFRLQFDAVEAGKYFKVNAIDCTLTSAGQMV